MCDIRYTSWDRPATDRDFAALVSEAAMDESVLLQDFVRQLTEAFPRSMIRPPVFVFGFVTEAFRSWRQRRVLTDPVVPGAIRLPLGAYVYDRQGAVVARYQTDLLRAVHEGVPRFLMSAQSVHRLNAALARFGFVFTTGHCCEVILLSADQLPAYLNEPAITAREAARQRANEAGIPFRPVRSESDLPPACDFSCRARELHARLEELMTRLAGPVAQAMQPLSATVSVPVPETFASA